MRVSQTAHWLEWLDWADEILKEPFTKENGFIEIPDKPGLGIEWDEVAIAKNAYPQIKDFVDHKNKTTGVGVWAKYLPFVSY